MADFQAQVEGLTGLTVATTPTTTELSQFLNDGVIDITNRCIAVSPKSLDNFLRQSSEQTSNGFNPGTNKVVAVLRENGTNNQWYPCTRSSMELEYRVTDKDSFYYASKYNPVYMISQNRNIHVYPEPSADGNDTFKVLYINYSPEESDGSALDESSTGIKWFPDDKVYLVVIYASIQSLTNALSSKAIASDISLPVTPGAPTLPSVPEALILAAAPVNFTLPDIPGDVDVVFTAVPAAPTFGMQTLSITTVPNLSWALPSSVTAPALNTETFTLPDSPTEVSAPSIIVPQLAIDDFPTDISWVFPTVPVSPTLDYSVIVQTVSEITFPSSVVLPTVTLDAAPDLSWGFPAAPIAPVLDFSGVTQAVDAIVLPAAAVLPSGLDVTAAPATTWTTPAPPVMQSLDWGDLENWFTEEDPEMGNMRIAAVSAQASTFQNEIQAYQALINADISKNSGIIKAWSDEQMARVQVFSTQMSAEMDKYRSEAQGAQTIAQAQIAVFNGQVDQVIKRNGAEIQAFQGHITGYQAQLQAVIAENQAEVQAWSTEFSTKLQQYQTEAQALISLYQADISKASAIPQSELAVRQTQVQEAISKTDNEIKIHGAAVQTYQAEVRSIIDKNRSIAENYQVEWNTKTQKHATDIQAAGMDLQVYQGDVQEYSSRVQQYSAEIQGLSKKAELSNSGDAIVLQQYSAELNQYNVELTGLVTFNQGQVDEWTKENGVSLQKYSADVQQETARVSNDAAVYQQEIQKALAEYQAETGYDISKYNTEVGAKLQRYQGEIARYQAEDSASIQNYQIDVNKYQAEVAAKMQSYQADIAKYQAEVASLIQDYSARLQADQLDYTWMQSRLQELKVQYNEAFAIMAPKQQQQAAQARR